MSGILLRSQRSARDWSGVYALELPMRDALIYQEAVAEQYRRIEEERQRREASAVPLEAARQACLTEAKRLRWLAFHPKK